MKAPEGFDLTRRQAADYLGVKMSTLNQWAWAKKNIPYVVMGGVAWYRRADLDALLRRRTVKVDAA